jgi:hypothetical protein
MPTTTGSAPSAARCAAALCRAAPRITGTAKHTGIACAGLSWRRSADQSPLLPLPPRRRGITPPPVCHHRRLCPHYAPRLKRASLLPPGAASEQSSTPRESWFRAPSSLGHCRRAQAYSRRRQQQQQQPHRLRAPARLQARKTRPTRAARRVISPIVLVQRLPPRRRITWVQGASAGSVLKSAATQRQGRGRATIIIELQHMATRKTPEKDLAVVTVLMLRCH